MKNVLGTSLKVCSKNPVTGFYRDGFCNTGKQDSGSHVVASIMTKDFLDFTRLMGNDLSTPNSLFDFPGLKPGDRWCLCAMRWKEAYLAGCAPPVILQATNEAALRFVKLSQLIEMGHEKFSS